MLEPQVILVDENDKPIGLMGKQQAHVEGILHRAFSVLLFNHKGQILLQKRASSKYHSPGLWTNTCCSHPAPDETLEHAVDRRLKEELNLSAPTKHLGSFTYHVTFEDGMIEHEFDHIFVGQYNQPLPPFNLEEVDLLKWMDWEDLLTDMSTNSHEYTYWFKIIIEQFAHPLKKYIHENL